MVDRIRKVVFGALLLAVVCAAPRVVAQAISQGYRTSGAVQPGMLVVPTEGDGGSVSAAAQTRAADIIGVAVTNVDAPATIAGDDAQIYVSTTGTSKLLVSDENGSIAVGDYVSVSSVAGVAMKTDSKQAMVAAVAREGFSGSSPISTASVSLQDGTTKTVKVGRIQADIQIRQNPKEQQQGTENIPGFLQSAGKALAGKDVSARRIYIALALLLASSTISGLVVYGAIKSSLVSLGRNPLGRATIFRSMIQVLVVGFFIFIVGLVGVYLILRL
jgi:hypothetical protein